MVTKFVRQPLVYAKRSPWTDPALMKHGLRNQKLVGLAIILLTLSRPRIKALLLRRPSIGHLAGKSALSLSYSSSIIHSSCPARAVCSSSSSSFDPIRLCVVWGLYMYDVCTYRACDLSLLQKLWSCPSSSSLLSHSF